MGIAPTDSSRPGLSIGVIHISWRYILRKLISSSKQSLKRLTPELILINRLTRLTYILAAAEIWGPEF